ncbi:30S ribosomal protein S5 [Fusobacterium sp.]|uniref:30S ribosomal protein S5 n=1 Tax=Fusobacterium sp. TaxID=68766 RepID=UPI0029040FF0|nr:30S ribosomal protein S5 [Fusobacterium sp.]MDU1911716.1 30S ribosomal protein S5 [Fusobacterium sp.]
MSKLANREEKQYQEKLLKISRVSKTTKGGRTISFSVLAAIGDGEGKIGLGLGKANGVPDAIKKAIASAKKNMVEVSLKGKTIPHEIIGKWGATALWMAPAYEGTGVIAGSAAREILELVGVHDILTKIKGSRNKHNVARATVEALKMLRTAEKIAAQRGKEVKDILS